MIFEKVKDVKAQEYYLQMAVEQGWSRNVLLHQIKTDAYSRHRKVVKQHNFAHCLRLLLNRRMRQ